MKKKAATKKERAAIVKALKERRVEFAGDESSLSFIAKAKAGIPLTKEDWAFTKVALQAAWGKWRKGKVGNDGGFEVSWQTKGCGFGGATFYLSGKKLHCHNETMSKAFLKEMMCALIDTCILDDE